MGTSTLLVTTIAPEGVRNAPLPAYPLVITITTGVGLTPSRRSTATAFQIRNLLITAPHWTGQACMHPAQTFLHDQHLILANLHVDPGYKANGQLVQRPVVEFTDTNYRLGIRFQPNNGGNKARAASNCEYIQYQHTAGKFQATDTEVALTGLSGYKTCIVTFGTAATDISSTTKKYAVTCSLTKYFNCRYSSATSAKCDAVKTSACVKVCRAEDWSTCEDNGVHGECAATSDCAEDCAMDGRSESFWCAVKVAGL